MKIQGPHLSLFGITLLLTLALGLPSTAGAQGMISLEPEIYVTQMKLEQASSDRSLRLRLVQLHFIDGTRSLEVGENAAAIHSFYQGLNAADEGAGVMSDREEIIRLIYYGLALALERMGRDDEAIPILDGLAVISPDFYLGRYLLGITLMRSPDLGELHRGIKVMRQLHSEVDFSMKVTVAQAGANLAYNRAVSETREGHANIAVDILVASRAAFGDHAFNTAIQTQNYTYALGNAYDQSASTGDAVTEYEMTYLTNNNYSTSGVSITAVLSTTAYKRALELLAQKTVIAAQDVLSMLDLTESLSGEAADIYHGRYLAYMTLGDRQAAETAKQNIENLYPAYYNRITR